MPDNKFVRDVYNIDPASVFHVNDDGSLEGRPSVTCVGVFPYLQMDGSIFAELRLPEEVFADATLDSLRMIPVTNDHPIEFVTPDNISMYQVGMTGEDVCRLSVVDGEAYAHKTDGMQVTIPMKITERNAIEAVKAGKRGLSCGYTRDLELTSGTWCGVPYDGIQRNIRYNHVAIVDRGRAGDTAVIRMDSADDSFVPVFLENEEAADAGIENKEASMPMKNLVLDSATFEVEEVIADAFEALQNEKADVCKERDEIRGQLDMANQTIDSLKAEMAGMIKADVLLDKVHEYQSIKETADRYQVSLSDDMSIFEMKKAVVKVANPAIADGIDDCSEEYINGAFFFCTKMEAQGARHDSCDEETDAGEQNDADHADNRYFNLEKKLIERYGNK